MDNFFKKLKTGVLVTCILLLSSCNDTDQYYESLKDQPQLLKDYDPIYGVGDTLLIKGRFNPDNVVIYIGGVEAKIAEIRNVAYRKEYNDSIQYLKLLIDETMGLGQDRAIHITSSGITIEAGSIEIMRNSVQKGLLEQPLSVQKIADYPVGTVPVYCRSGNGSLYFFNTSDYSLLRMTPDGNIKVVFEADKFIDKDGATFQVTRFNGAGIDPKERYVYLSFYTEAPERTRYHYYRLCRYDMVNGEFTVLNKTPYHIYKSGRKLSDVQPFEGKIDEVKMFAATAIYPDSLGNVWIDMDRKAVTLLDKEGNYSYRFKNKKYNYSGHFLSPFDRAPEIADSSGNSFYSDEQVVQLLPGVLIDYYKIRGFEPNGGEMYTEAITRYNLKTQKRINSFTNKTDPNALERLIVAGPFRVLTGRIENEYGYGISDFSLWGRMPLSDGKLLVLCYQGQGKSMPAWAVIDFAEEEGFRYAPGTFETSTYMMKDQDELLNMDAEGMLYMTANDRNVILKTVYK